MLSFSRLYRHRLNVFSAFLLTVLIGAFLYGCSSLKAPVEVKHAADLFTHDQTLVMGTFENGLTYVLKKNQEPRNRVSMHLVIRAGSVQERDDQRGVAHYLEHMLFNGSENFPPGELVKYFQNIGMQFGDDANAHTGFNETVYDVLLPGGDSKNLEDGLKVMKDYAKGALLLESEVQREKNIILAEKRDRDSADYRTFEAVIAFELPDMILAKRLPIGTEEVIKSVDRNTLKDYYDTWYRPDKMTLVMVGDFEPDMAKDLIQKAFSDLTSRAPAPKEPEPGIIDHKGIKAFYHYEKESGKTEVSFEKLTKEPIVADSFEQRKSMMIERVASAMMQNRLDVLVRKPDCPVTSSSASSGVFLRHVRYTNFAAEASPDKWEQAISFIDQNLRQALTFGFSAEELNRVKKDVVSGLEQAVKTASTRDSSGLSAEIIGTLSNDRKIISPEASLKLFKPVIDDLDLKTVNEMFRKSWSPDHLLIIVAGNADLKGQTLLPEKRILSAYEASLSVKVVPKADDVNAVFPYLPEPKVSGKIKTRQDIADLGLTMVEFENGVKLNLKKTDFDANQIVFKLIFGDGKSREPLDKTGLASLAMNLVNESGFKSMDNETLKRALSGTNTQVGFMILEDSFALGGSTTPSEIALAFQLMETQLKDPGFRQESYDLIMKRMKQNYEEMEKTVDGVETLRSDRFLAGNDPRFGLPPFDVYSKNTVADVEAWVGRALAEDSLELSIVGDMDIDAVIEIAARYLGSLPQGRKNPNPLVKGKDPVPSFPTSRALVLTVPTEIPKGQVKVAYPTDDFWNISQTRRLSVLGAVFSEKLRNIIREELGAAYSPYAYNHASLGFPGYGFFQAVVGLDPQDAGNIVKHIKEISDDIRKKGITDDELKRAVDPIVTSIKDMRRTNNYWLNSVMSGSGRYKEKLDWARSMEKDYASITVADIRKMAEMYLDNGKAATVVIVPETK
ncbi:MAG: insulinase family protein [Desulfobacteraceae bacterium]|jgi:zinc protease